MVSFFAHFSCGNYHRLRRVVCMCQSGYLSVYSASANDFVLHWLAHDVEVTCLTVGPDATLLASGSQDASVKVWRNDDPQHTVPTLHCHLQVCAL